MNLIVSEREKYRPYYHFTPERNWMNDPNGLVYYEGEYHLFYQYHPFSTVWGPMHWGHAVSTDLINWRHLPVALEPDEHGMIFSGSAVVDWHDSSGFFGGGSGLVAFFTHHDSYPDGARRERQSIAYSSDKGRTWTKFQGNPVLDDESQSDFRDPKVFQYKPDGRWIMLLAANDRIMLYGSYNLREWTFLSEFGSQDGMHGGVWECPDLFELPVEGTNDSKWLLMVSDAGRVSGIQNTQYFVGHFDGTRFINDNSPETILWADFGADYYAAQSWSDTPDGRRIWLSWMSNFGYYRETPTEAFRSILSFPRELDLVQGSEGVRLRQRPIAEIDRLRKNEKQLEHFMLEGRHPLPSLSTAMEIEVVFETAGSSERFGVTLRQGAEHQTVVGYDTGSRELHVDRTKTGEHNFDASGRYARNYGGPLQPENGRVSLRILLDSSSVEVFGNGGTTVISQVLFPDPNSTGLELFAEGGAVRVVSCRLYDLGGTNEGQV
ncbi:MAG: SacC2 [Paenibacillus sp.]|nr:SacC2 [Paenibacillus sp.]